jgi:hypothetical protein
MLSPAAHEGRELRVGGGMPEAPKHREHRLKVIVVFRLASIAGEVCRWANIAGKNTHPKGGTVLGLANAKQIVEMHGGRIWVESTVGKRSTFQMEIPARGSR